MGQSRPRKLRSPADASSPGDGRYSRACVHVCGLCEFCGGGAGPRQVNKEKRGERLRVSEIVSLVGIVVGSRGREGEEGKP